MNFLTIQKCLFIGHLIDIIMRSSSLMLFGFKTCILCVLNMCTQHSIFWARSGFIIIGRSCFPLIFTTFRCWMTKMFAGDFERVTIKARREWSRLSALCPWGWTMAGTRFSLTCRTSPGGLTEPITLRRCVYRLVQGHWSSRFSWCCQCDCTVDN